MLAEWLDGVLHAALWLTALIPLLALLRPLLLRLGGPNTVYAAWVLLPLAVLGSLWPWSVPATLHAWQLNLPSPTPWLGSPSAPAATGPEWMVLLAAVWALGALLQCAYLWHAQRRYVQALRLLPGAGHLPQRAQAAHAVPALLGVWRPRLVLPVDFEDRYTAQQQRLILAHEAEHARRRDPLVHLLASGLRVLLWFHPLVHRAHAWLRRDQELACDHAVLARHPGQRRAYAEALLITQLDRPGLPVGCTWQSSHPLKERLVMLKHPTPGVAQRWTARALLAGLALGISLVSIAAAPDWTPELLEQPLPKYPMAALDARQAGQVTVTAEVLRDGRVGEVRIASAEPAGVFDASALASVRQARFAPAPDGSRATSAWVQVPITYSLNEAD